jgi:hypothetical protein
MYESINHHPLEVSPNSTDSPTHAVSFSLPSLLPCACSTVDAFLFLVGSAYFCAGSYPQDAHSTHPQKARDVCETVNEESPLINGGIRPLKKDMNV